MPAKVERLRPPRRVLVHGLAYFGKVLAEFMNSDGWEFVYYPDQGLKNLAAMIDALRRCDLVYQIGGRVSTGKFLWAARLLNKRNFVMHWVGSDTLDERKEVGTGKTDPWVLNQVHHWADSEWLFQEVQDLGVSCDFVPLPSPRTPAVPFPLPDKFSVLVYVPSLETAKQYGLDMILEAARRLPEVRFELVGLRDGPIPDPPRNLHVHNRIPNLTDFFRQASVVWRPARHDGLSWMVLEALGYGRHVLWTYPFPGCVHAASASEAVESIRQLHELHKCQALEINEAGVKFIAESQYGPYAFKRNILSRMEEILTYPEKEPLLTPEPVQTYGQRTSLPYRHLFPVAHHRDTLA